MKNRILTLTAVVLSILIVSTILTNAAQTSKLDLWQKKHPKVHFEVPTKLRGNFYSYEKSKTKPWYQILSLDKNGVEFGRQGIGEKASFTGFPYNDLYIIGSLKGNAFRIGRFNDYSVNALNTKDEKIYRLHRVKINGKWVKAVSIASSVKKGTKAKLYFAKKIQKSRVTTKTTYDLKWSDTK